LFASATPNIFVPYDLKYSVNRIKALYEFKYTSSMILDDLYAPNTFMHVNPINTGYN
jgi:hypothetical protein